MKNVVQQAARVLILSYLTLFIPTSSLAQQSTLTYRVLSNDGTAEVEVQRNTKTLLLNNEKESPKKVIVKPDQDGSFMAWGKKGKVVTSWDIFKGRLLASDDILWPDDAWVRRKPKEPLRVTLQNRAGNGFLEIQPAQILNNGGYAAQFSETNGGNQQWLLHEILGDKTCYRIENVASGKFLTWDKPLTNVNDSPIFQWELTGEYNQFFEFKIVSDEYIEIRCKQSEKCLQVDPIRISEPSASVRYAEPKSQANQQWRMFVSKKKSQ